jgi:hypothetical protein
LGPALTRLGTLASAPVPRELRAWAEVIGAPAGPMPLLGTGVRAAAYPALLWNGARLHHAAAPDDDGLVLVALAAARPDADAADIDRAVTVGRAVSAGLPGVLGDGAVTASPTIDVVATAACAAVAGGTDPSALGPVLDVAAALMVMSPPSGGTPREAGLRAGHGLAAGWLAPRVLAAGLTGMAGALVPTVSTVTGRPAGELRGDLSGGVPAPEPTGSPARELLAGLA